MIPVEVYIVVVYFEDGETEEVEVWQFRKSGNKWWSDNIGEVIIADDFSELADDIKANFDNIAQIVVALQQWEKIFQLGNDGDFIFRNDGSKP